MEALRHKVHRFETAFLKTKCLNLEERLKVIEDKLAKKKAKKARIKAEA